MGNESITVRSKTDRYAHLGSVTELKLGTTQRVVLCNILETSAQQKLLS